MLLQDQLKKVGSGVEVEVHDLLDVLAVGHGTELVEETLDDLGLTETGEANKHWCVVDLNELPHDVLSGNRVGSGHCVALDTLGSIDRSNNLTSRHLVPVLKLGVLDIDIVVEDGTFAWELDDLSFLTLPPVGEQSSVVFSVLFSEASTDAPNASEDEDPFNALDIVVVQDVLNELADGNDHGNLHLWDDVLECFLAMEKSVGHVLLEEKRELSKILLTGLQFCEPRLDIGSPLVTCIVRDV